MMMMNKPRKVKRPQSSERHVYDVSTTASRLGYETGETGNNAIHGAFTYVNIKMVMVLEDGYNDEWRRKLFC